MRSARAALCAPVLIELACVVAAVLFTAFFHQLEHIAAVRVHRHVDGATIALIGILAFALLGVNMKCSLPIQRRIRIALFLFAICIALFAPACLPAS